MKSLKALALGLLLLCVISSIAVPTFAHGSHDEHDEDEFGEYDEFEMVGTAAPYIPPKTEEKVAQKPASSKKQANYDDEEFEGSAMGHMDFEKVPELKIDNTVPQPVVPFQYNFIVEIGSISFLVLFAINYFIGRKTNEKIASTFARTFRDLFSSEFSTVGVNGAVLVKESQHTFRLNATGRANCIGIQANLRLRRRHDLVGLLYSKFWSPSRDMLDIQVALNNETIDTLIFALCKNRDARSISKDFADLSSYTKTYKIPQETPKTEANLDSEVWTAMGEAKELFPSILDQATRTTLNRHKDAVRLIHVTDQYSEHKEYKKVLHVVFYLPEIEKLEELRTLILMTFHMIDQLARVKIPSATKLAIEKSRSKVVTDEKKEELEAKREELEQKKLEKRREKMKNMDANERADFEEKERQRKMNKRMKKMTVKM